MLTIGTHGTCPMLLITSSSESAERHDDYILKLFCVVLPVGYCEVMFLYMCGFCLWTDFLD